MIFPPTGIGGVEHFSSSVTNIMAPKRSVSKDAIKSSTREEFESTSFYLPVYSDTQLFPSKEPNKIEFELKEEEPDSTEEKELEDEEP